MHECPECYQMCDCDGEDHHNDAATVGCVHPETPECLEDAEADDYPEEYEYEDLTGDEVDEDEDLACRRHGCEHPESVHADMRSPSGRRRLYRGPCARCACPEYVEDLPPCHGVPVITVTAASGKLYTRCACGVVREGV